MMTTELESLKFMAAGVHSNDISMQMAATVMFRKLLCSRESATFEKVIQVGVVPRFVEFLTREDLPELQVEAGWALAIIASGTSEYTRVVVDHGAVPYFVTLLRSPNEDVRDQAVWALGNIAGDSAKYRDFVLQNGALIPLLQLFNQNARLSMLRTATWVLSNFCRGKPKPPLEQVKPSLPALKSLIYSNDEEVLTHACWALSDLIDGTIDYFQAVTDAGVCKRVVELLLYPSPSVVNPALKFVGIIASGDDAQTQIIIDNGALPCLSKLLTLDGERSIQKDACWTISNIAAGNSNHIQAVIEAGLIPHLINLFQTAAFDIKNEAAWAIFNAICLGTPDQIKFLVNEGCIKPLCDHLICSDPKIVYLCLEGLENILKVGEGDNNLGSTGYINYFAQEIELDGGSERIKNLQSHIDNDIRQKAVKLFETYWLEDQVKLQAALRALNLFH